MTKLPSEREKKLRHARGILNKHKSGAILSKKDTVFLLELLQNHPHAEEKIGCGVRAISVMEDTKWKRTKHFVLIRLDGSKVDFSYSKCIDGVPSRDSPDPTQN